MVHFDSERVGDFNDFTSSVDLPRFSSIEVPRAEAILDRPLLHFIGDPDDMWMTRQIVDDAWVSSDVSCVAQQPLVVLNRSRQVGTRGMTGTRGRSQSSTRKPSRH